MTDLGTGVHGNTTWSAERVELLRSEWADGRSAGQIALTFGVSRNTIIGKIHRLKLPSRQTTSSTRYTYSRGMTREQKAKRQSEHRARQMIAQLFARAAKRSLPPTPPETVVTQPDLPPRMIPLLDLQREDCRYPFGEGPYFFCGHPATHKRYCALHYKVTHHREGA